MIWCNEIVKYVLLTKLFSHSFCQNKPQEVLDLDIPKPHFQVLGNHCAFLCVDVCFLFTWRVFLDI